MTTAPSDRHFVTFGTAEFIQSAEYALDAARPYFSCLHPWNPARLRSTPFYAAHRAVLDEPRGGGYWLWKPFILREALAAAREGEVVMYLDAGAALIGDPEPLVSLCERDSVVLFAGHYRTPSVPNTCRHWTKRDCFVLMNCDQTRYHDAPMADASVLLVRNDASGRAFVAEWLQYATNPLVLTDAPNRCGRDNLPGFVDHRHDQSVLSLLAARDGRTLWRGPSQHGNHCKADRWRVPGEWRRLPYGADGVYADSDYGTLVNHHRARTLFTTKTAPRLPAALVDLMREWRSAPAQHMTADEACESLTYEEALRYLCASLADPLRLLVLGSDPDGMADGLRRHDPRIEIVRAIERPRGLAPCGDRFNVVLCTLDGHALTPLSALQILCWSRRLAPDSVVALRGLWTPEDIAQTAGFRQAGSPVPTLVGTARGRGASVQLTALLRCQKQP